MWNAIGKMSKVRSERTDFYDCMTFKKATQLLYAVPLLFLQTAGAGF